MSDKVLDFFKRSQGQWLSNRKYFYFYPNVEIVEMYSKIDVVFLEGASEDLLDLTKIFEEEEITLEQGVKIKWYSYREKDEKVFTQGEIVFGIYGDKLYRSRGYGINKPVISSFQMPNNNQININTFYNETTFDENIKFVSDTIRTRQTVAKKDNLLTMIGQYVEKKVS